MIEKIGKKKFETRKFIIDMLTCLDGISDEFVEMDVTEESGTDKKFRRSTPHKETEYANSYVQVKEALRSVIEEVFQDEKDEIHTNVSEKLSEFFEDIEYYGGVYGRRISVYHYLLFHVNPLLYHDRNVNIEKLYHILPWMFSKRQNYQPFFTYSTGMIEDMEGIVMPYYILTDNCLMQMTVDMENAVIYRSQEMIEMYRQRVKENQKDGTRPLIFERNTLNYFMENCVYYLEEFGKRTYELEPCPCIGSFGVTQEELEEKKESANGQFTHEEQKNMAWSGEMKIQANNAFSAEGVRNCFTEAGLAYLCETGSVRMQIASLATPCDVARRREILGYIVDAIRRDGSRYRIVEEKKLNLWNLNVILFERGVFLMLMTGENEYSIILVQESSILEGFTDFMDSLEDMGWVKSAEETAEIVKKYYETL